VHKGGNGAACEQCHQTQSWKAATFDHDRQTRFALTGAHGGLACATCHQSARFKDAPADCAGCHREDDPHKGAYKGDCAGCHNPSGWANWVFDHGRTPFPLDGRHQDLACTACHRRGRPLLTASCGSCHQGDDIHQGAFGPECGQLSHHARLPGHALPVLRHDFRAAGTIGLRICKVFSLGWARGTKVANLRGLCPRVEDSMTPERARGGFAAFPCRRLALLLAVLVLAILGAASLGLAAPAKPPAVPAGFDHLKTGFPLTDAHKAVACDGCHAGGVFKATPRECASCHDGKRAPGKPSGHLPTSGQCDDCHGTVVWSEARFNHNDAEGDCASCHNGTTAPGKPNGHIPTSAACDDCHVTTTWTSSGSTMPP